MIAFILIAAAFNLAAGAQTLQQLQKKRDAFLVNLEKKHPTDYLSGLSQELNQALLGGDAELDQAAWLSFVLDSSAVHPFLKQGDALNLADALQKASQKLVEDTLPAVGSDKYLENQKFMCEGKGYQTMIPYIFSDFGSVLHNYLAAKFMDDVRKHYAGQAAKSENLDFAPITEPFTAPLLERLEAYVDACEKPASGPQAGQSESNWKKNEAIRVGNVKVELHNLVSSKTSFVVNQFLSGDYLALVEARNFLVNAYSKISNEVEYLTALVVAAPEKLDQVLPRIQYWGSILIRLADAGIKVLKSNTEYTKLTVDSLATPWAYAMVEAIQNLEGQSQETVAEIFGTLMQQLTANGHANVAFAMAQNVYSYLVNGGRSFGQKSVAKVNLEARPFTGESVQTAVDALRAWDHISEAPKGDQNAIEWFKSISAHYKDILAVPQQQVAALNFARALFTASLVPASETKLYATLYEAMTHFMVSGASLAQDDFAKNFNSFLDKNSGDNLYFIIMKLMVANHFPHGNYPISFPGATNDLASETARLLEQPAFEKIMSAVVKAHQAMGHKGFNKTVPKTALERLEEVITGIQQRASHGQEFLSDNFRILNIVASSQKII